jgi:DNA polymerase I-like protein with 3'-5' exonuclease and polymerase domains
MIEIKRVHRILRDEKEFKKYKSIAPFEGIRQVAKSANFSLLFGAAPHTFMRNTLEPMWSSAQAEDFIKVKKLDDLKEKLINGYVKKQRPIPENIDYLTCSTYIRDTFFKKYPGLLYRIERNKELVETQGYTRTFHGVIRRLPLMLLTGVDDDIKEISGWVNIAANSPIQSLEVMKVMPALVKINRWFRRMGYKSRVWGTVHDSVDFYLYRPELKYTIPKIYEIFEEQETWQKDVPLSIDLHIADPLKGEIYHGGKDAKKLLKEMSV